MNETHPAPPPTTPNLVTPPADRAAPAPLEIVGTAIAPSTPYRIAPVDPKVRSFNVIGPDGVRDETVVFHGVRRRDAQTAVAMLSIGFQAGIAYVPTEVADRIRRTKIVRAALDAVSDMRSLVACIDPEQYDARGMREVLGGIADALEGAI